MAHFHLVDSKSSPKQHWVLTPDGFLAVPIYWQTNEKIAHRSLRQTAQAETVKIRLRFVWYEYQEIVVVAAQAWRPRGRLQ